MAMYATHGHGDQWFGFANGVHLYLAEGDAERRRGWVAVIDKIAALDPKAVIAGHKAPGSDDGPRQLDETRQYLKDAEEISQVARHAKEFADLMTLRHLFRINPAMLALSAERLFPGNAVA
ncbi:hypothetical protein ACIRU3_44150 [Streptomyces sp. NPDC101151]|uniref:hypothetical protein n=1 Tax=Streptomyces sp. NPDC101151 TaxID=3366115 RepID=UPI00381F80A3